MNPKVEPLKVDAEYVDRMSNLLTYLYERGKDDEKLRAHIKSKLKKPELVAILERLWNGQ